MPYRQCPYCNAWDIDDLHKCPTGEDTQPLKRWTITRWIKEEFEVTAISREKALENVRNPHTVTVNKEICVEMKD